MLDTCDSQNYIHCISSHCFSLVLSVPEAARATGVECQSGEVGSRASVVWGCSVVEFLRPLLVKTHRLVFKIWCFNICLIVEARSKHDFS